MSIEKYREKRSFDKTPEPEPSLPKHRGPHPLTFCVQRHHATNLHYDFRLELDGALKSWAVPKGPTLDPIEKRLAMMVEDHPYDYAHFEGTIPEGNYGAGTVMIWDIGTWENLGPDPQEGLKKGKLHFRLEGRKLKGEWALVQMHGPRATKGNEWLLLKHGTAQKPVSAKQDDTSAVSGRSMAEISGPHSRKWISHRSVNGASAANGPPAKSFKNRVALMARKIESKGRKTRAMRH